MLNDVVKTASKMSNNVIVSFSGGKDSVVVLDLCHRYFKTVHAFFMYQVKGLSFQERVLKYYEKKYGIEIMRVPHFELSAFLRFGYFRAPDYDVNIVSVADIYSYVRGKTAAEWIAGGEKINDSIWRRAVIKKSGSIDSKRRRVYPLSYWNKKQIEAYVKQNKLKYSIESEFLKRGSSFGDFSPYSMAIVKRHFPKDYETILKWFPLIEASVKKYEIHGTKTGSKQVPKLSD